MRRFAVAYLVTALLLFQPSFSACVGSTEAQRTSVAFPKEIATAHKTGNHGQLRKFLQSRDSAERALAAIALRDFPYPGYAPHLIKLLNDVSPLEWGESCEETTPSEEAVKTLAVIERKRMSAKPGNLGKLDTWFTYASTGTGPERKAAIEILGRLQEPLAVPLLSAISEGDPDVLSVGLSEGERTDIRERAGAALSSIGPGSPKDLTLAKLEQSAHLAVAVGCLTVIVVIVVVIVTRQRKKREPIRLAASIIPVALLAGFTVAMFQEYRISGVGYEALIDALVSGDSRALARRLVMERSEFPGDSHAAQYFVSAGDPAVFDSVGRLDVLKDDFVDTWMNSIRKRRQWIMARIVAQQLIESNLREFASAGGSERKVYVAETLRDLGVRRDDILALLNDLSLDEDKQVANAAKDALPRVKKYPEWKGYPFSELSQDG